MNCGRCNKLLSLFIGCKMIVEGLDLNVGAYMCLWCLVDYTATVHISSFTMCAQFSNVIVALVIVLLAIAWVKRPHFRDQRISLGKPTRLQDTRALVYGNALIKGVDKLTTSVQ